MKLKFVINKEDWDKFIIICVVLFFVIAMVISNITMLITEQELSGLNFIYALKPPLLFYTIIFTFLTIIAVIFSVDDKFFTRKEGFGIEIGDKKSDGYNKLAEKKDYIDVLKPVTLNKNDSKYAGVPLLYDKRNEIAYVDDGESHNLVIGTTGSGKTVSVINPMVEILAKKRESMVITDPKGEIYAKKGNLLRVRGYNIIVLNFREPEKGNAWNPLDLPFTLYKNKDYDKSIELVDDLANNILKSKKTDDQYWNDTAGDYFTGLTLGLLEDAKTSDEVNLNSVMNMHDLGEERLGASTYIKEYMNSKDKTGNVYGNLSGTVNAPDDTRSSIVSIFKSAIKIFTSKPGLSEMLSYSDFAMDDIGKKPTAVFLIIHDEKTTYHSLASIFIKQCYESLIDVAQKNGGKLPVRTNLLLDEFANMPTLKDITSMVTAARSRQIRLTFIIQNFAQLNDVYGKETAETIKGNCGNLIYLLTTELTALEEISKMAGEQKSKEKEKTASTPLITITDLQKMKMFDAIIIRHRQSPLKTTLTPDFKLDWGRTFPPLSFKTREPKEMSFFDIKTYVKNQKKEALKKKGIYKENTSFSSINDDNNMQSLIDKINKRIKEIDEEEGNTAKPEEASTPSFADSFEKATGVEKKVNEKLQENKDFYGDFFNN